MRACAPALLHIGLARRIAQAHVGNDSDVIACWPGRDPEPAFASAAIYKAIHGIAPMAHRPEFHFAVLDRHPIGVGGTRCIAVCRLTGKVRELGNIGE